MEAILAAFLSPWVLLLITFVTLLYLHLTWHFNYWKNMDVPYIKPLPFFGNMKDRLLFRTSFHEMQVTLYQQLKGHAVGGVFEGRNPVLVVRDPDLIRQIMVKDFESFVDRRIHQLRPESIEENMLIFLKGSQWKDVRTLSTPIFSSGKIKAMVELVSLCTGQMVKYLDQFHANQHKEVEMKEFFGRFTLDVIASCAFGVQCDSLENPDAEFVRILGRFNEISMSKRVGVLISMMVFGSPRLAKLLGVHFMNPEVIEYLVRMLRDTKEHREKLPPDAPRRQDFLQLMLDAQAGRLKATEAAAKDLDLFEKEAQMNGSATKPPSHAALTDKVVLGQSLLFLLAGFETSSTLLTFACYELALHPELQERTRAEVLKVATHHGGHFDYDALGEMHYLENVLMETLRKHPPVARVERVCTADEYVLANTSVKLRRGDVVSIPIKGLHHDEAHYPDPETFDPDRFTPENRHSRSPYVFLPFGSGPRNCIGMRFAMMSSKLAMASLLQVFSFEPCAKTEIPYRISKTNMMLKAANGIWLNVNRI